ncbi:DUF4373 domain-containing protein [Brevibacillus borstelensis]|uniref:DUF4373 domain-containing protein n=1 Tax=Brevibacillus borstelensis TaxID=45462 RepID=UPI00068EBA2D|nr:DUF4373 domain-containing protein [Brevibacillus borstelensis]MED1881091.1 DUF4373 domain-containing protein [Brevibacillus borstelensis]MED2006725.1 DUF4373 domain-containing protein [Brevibacillus borstelensis]RNB66377.1 DUF4373 domain-containing protein [Brevibacillus borstelensis]GED53512.1 hypothetical protein BBO01nite_27530 [Brevibacillus borstelensis]
MARPQKEGLDYFPLDLDIDQDDKLVVPIAKFGMQGFGIIIKLMMEIYRNGYFYQWGEKEQYVFASRVNVDINVIVEVVNECIKWGFFSQKLYEEHHILTSKGFQKRYIEAAKRRKEIVLMNEYLLVDVEELSQKFKIPITVVNVTKTTVNENINPSKSDSGATETPQSKVKESKVKNKRNPPRHPKTYAEDTLAFKIAAYLHKKIMEYAEALGVSHLVKNANLQKWADECRKIIEIDKRDKDEVRRLIDWTTSHNFWQRQILSPTNLRKHYEKLCIEMAAASAGSRKTSSGYGGGVQADPISVTESPKEQYEPMPGVGLE